MVMSCMVSFDERTGWCPICVCVCVYVFCVFACAVSSFSSCAVLALPHVPICFRFFTLQNDAVIKSDCARMHAMLGETGLISDIVYE